MKHRHKTIETTDRPYTGPVSRTENRAAHGGICRVDRCECGAERRVNVNGVHREIGTWVKP